MPAILPALALLLATPAQLVLAPESRIFLEGDSNVRRWSCDSGQLALAGLVDTGSDERPPSVAALTIDLEVATLRCGDPHMEEKLRESLASDRFPLIRYRFRAAEVIRGAPPGEVWLLAKGELTVRGITRAVELPVRAEVAPDRGLRAQGALPLRMSDFGVDPPSAFLGLVQSKDELLVRFELRGRAIDFTD